MDEQTYIFQSQVKEKQFSYIMTDSNENVVYQAIKINKKKHFFKDLFKDERYFNFIDNLTKKEQEHKISDSFVSSGYISKRSKNVKTQGNSFDYFIMHTGFKYDDKEIWDYLGEMGVTINGNYKDLLMNYEISLNGNLIAKIKKKLPEKGKNVSRSYYYCYEIVTNEKYIELLFLIALTLIITERLYYN